MAHPAAIIAGSGPTGPVNAVIDLLNPNAVMQAGQMLLTAMSGAQPGTLYAFTLLLANIQDGT